MKLFATLVASTYAAAGTDYTVQGDNWGESAPICNQERQSPIDIQSNGEQTFNMEDRNPFVTKNWYKNQDWTVAYKGGLKFTPEKENIFTMDGNLDTNTGAEPGSWVVAQFHLHWGQQNDDGSPARGSEHTFNDQGYFSEVHFVHYNTRYGSLGEAADKEDGLAVLGYFIDVSDEYGETDLDTILQSAIQNVIDHKAEAENDAADEAADEAADQATEEAAEEPAADQAARKRRADDDEWQNIVRFNAGNVVEGRFENYYRYLGSLTTPPCFETVQWTVFEEPLYINSKTLKMMSDMAENTPFEDNWRNVQELGDRIVTHYENTYVEVDSSAETASLTCALAAFVYGQL